MLEEYPTAGRLEMAFSRFLSQRATLTASEKQAFENIVITLIQKQNQGHNCIELDDQARALVLNSGLANEAGQQNSLLPLIVDRNLLYLQRYWHYENRLARQIKAMLHEPETDITCPEEKFQLTLDRYFGDNAGQTDYQRTAAEMAVKQAFCIITGGPGTGKTTTVVKILALLQELSAKPLHVALAAPTGKAAMRLQEAVGKLRASLPCTEAIRDHIPETVSTLHRLLGAKPPSPFFRHDAMQPLVYDLVVVDEASMVDLALMSKLLDALKPGARLILLGDKDQLASVESGSVLADLAAAETLRDSVAVLKTSHRFDGAIKQLADAVNAQQADSAWQYLHSEGAATLLNQSLVDYIAGQQMDYLQLLEAGAGFDAIYSAFSRFQVLCSNRVGKNSVADINRQVEQKLSELKWILNTSLWYSGRPVMVTQNNPSLHLFNGDIGLCMPDSDQNGKLMVFFQRADGSVKKYLPGRVPDCETVFAMTIHKSQGSEFDEVLIALPDAVNPVLTKELLYTAITRAKSRIRLVASEAVFKAAVRQSVERTTGLIHQFALQN
jgi:exodeoxyribonuclease V alpha subunit